MGEQSPRSIESERLGLLKVASFGRDGPQQPSAPLTGQALLNRIVGTMQASTQRVSESLDYEPVQNELFYKRLKAAKEKRHLGRFGYTGTTLAKFIITLVTGIATGVVAVGMSFSVHHMFRWKTDFIQEVLDEPEANRIWLAFLWHSAYAALLGVSAVALVQYWAPQAAGAGVTLVMAYLNGNHVPNLLRLRTLVAKFVGTVAAVGSGLPLGPEGPMIHLGACVASVITYAQCTCIRTGKWLSCFGRKAKTHAEEVAEKLKVLDDIVSDSDHREFVSSGAAAGISAAFGAPIGGVLWAMEEACSFWTKKLAWRCFVATCCATFTMTYINRNAQHGMLAITGVAELDNMDWIMQMVFVIVNAGMAGLLGAMFNSLRMWLWRLRASKTAHLLRMGEVLGLVLLTNVFGFFFSSVAGRCMPKSAEWGEDFGFRFNCEEGHHNDLATLFFSSSHDIVTYTFQSKYTPGQPYVTHLTNGSLALFMVIYLCLMSIAAGVAIPGGLFMPSMTVGAAWGTLFGQLLRTWLPKWNIQPGLYAAMAATGVLGSVFRNTISLVVLVVEGTRGIEFMFGIIISVVVANWVAHHIHHDGVYESELERIGNLYMLRDEPPHRLFTLTADAIMAQGVCTFKGIESVQHILQILRSTTHNGFPIVGGDVASSAAGGNTSSGGAAPAYDPDMLLGIILRSQLLVLLQHRHFCDPQGRPLGREPDEKCELELETEMRTFFRRYFTHNRYVSATATPLDALQLDTPGPDGTPAVDLSTLYLDLRPYMNRSPFTVRKDCSASRAHQAFLSLGLRHLVVVDAQNHCVGTITRKDLDHAAGHGWWRMSAVAPKPSKGGGGGFMDSAFVKKVASLGFLLPLGRRTPSQGNLATFMQKEQVTSSSLSTPRETGTPQLKAGVDSGEDGSAHGQFSGFVDGSNSGSVGGAGGGSAGGAGEAPRRGQSGGGSAGGSQGGNTVRFSAQL